MVISPEAALLWFNFNHGVLSGDDEKSIFLVAMESRAGFMSGCTQLDLLSNCLACKSGVMGSKGTMSFSVRL